MPNMPNQMMNRMQVSQGMWLALAFFWGGFFLHLNIWIYHLLVDVLVLTLQVCLLDVCLSAIFCFLCPCLLNCSDLWCSVESPSLLNYINLKESYSHMFLCVSLFPQAWISLTQWQCRTHRCLRHPWEEGPPPRGTILSRWTWTCQRLDFRLFFFSFHLNFKHLFFSEPLV